AKVKSNRNCTPCALGSTVCSPTRLRGSATTAVSLVDCLTRAGHLLACECLPRDAGPSDAGHTSPVGMPRTETGCAGGRVLSAFISSLRTVDLRRKILFTLGIVVLYRLGATVPSPGVNYPNVQKCIAQISGGDSAQIYSLINLFSGGALLQLTVFAVGVMPYITASIIVQLLTVVIPRFEELRKEGQAGHATMTQSTRYLATALAILQATSIVALEANGGLLQGCQQDIIVDQSIFTLVVIVL